MVSPPVGPPVVPLPGRLDRRLRLGPFPSGRDALKFLVYAGTSAVLAPTPFPFLAVPVVVVGLVVTLWRPGGEAVDSRLASRAGFLYRRWRGRAPVKGGRRPAANAAVAALGGGTFVAVVRTGGVPLAFLPPEELAVRFEQYRELLRALRPEVCWLATSARIHLRSVVPGDRPVPPSERAGRHGYTELIAILCRRRAVRQVYYGLVATETGVAAVAELRVAVSSLVDRLAALGLRAEPLRGRALWAAVARLGWRGEGEAG